MAQHGLKRVNVLAGEGHGGLGNNLAVGGILVRNGRSGVVGIDVYAAEGVPKRFGEIQLHGVAWRLVDRLPLPRL